MELSLDSTQNNQKKVPAKTLISPPPQEATNSSKSQPSYEEVRICAFGLVSFGFLGLCCQSKVQLSMNLEKIFTTLKKTFMVNGQPESSTSFLGRISVTQRIAQRLSMNTNDT